MRAFVPVAVGQVDWGLSVWGLRFILVLHAGTRQTLTGGFAATRFVHDGGSHDETRIY